MKGNKAGHAFSAKKVAMLKNYRARLEKESWLKSLLCGLTVGCGLDILCSLAFLFFGVKLFWIGIVVFAVGAAVTTPLFYFFRFQKTDREVAARVDTLGLEERILTMTQLEGDDSFMARRQKEDAVKALSTVNESLLKLAVSVPLIVICAVTFILGVGTTTASALSEKSIIQIIEENKQNQNDDTYIEIEYGVQGDVGGMIEGDIFQRILVGDSTDEVLAIAEDGYVFVGWSDGYDDACRRDSNLKEGMKVFAIFEEIAEDEEEDGDEGENSEKDDSSNQPSDSQKNSQPQEGDPNDSNNGGGASLPNNQVIDGSTYYGDEYGSSLSDAQDTMNAGTDLSGGQKDMTGDYFHGIAK